MVSEHEQLRRCARQHLETSRLLGLDFAPVAVAGPEPAAGAPKAPQGGAVQTLAPSSTLFSGAGGSVADLPAAQKPPALDALRARHDTECPHCTSVTGHTQTVFGEGDPDAALMFVGEAPGEEEDRTGRPFVGRAGRKLDDIIKAMGFERGDVYIANILKSRPPDNRTPLPSEVEGCSPFLAEQIRIIRPAVLVSLGSPATKWMLRTTTGISRLRGVWATYTDGVISIPVMPTFHPAYLLRSYTEDTRRKVWSDMQAVMRILRPAAQ